MKVMTVLGTRPEIIRLSRIIQKLDRCCDHILVHTGQNFNRNLNEIFFEDLGVRQPDHYLDARGGLGEQIGILCSKTETLINTLKPDKFLVLGDTNSALSTIIAKRKGVPVYHMEAGNRCFDDRVPEEVNRRIIDHSSDVLMPYTERSRYNLIREGFQSKRVHVIGNPIFEVLANFEERIAASTILDQLGVSKKEYFLVTLHRAENVDVEERLKVFSDSFEQLQQKYRMPIIISTHPHTRIKLREFGIGTDGNQQIRFMEPFGLFDFVHLEKNALCLLSDSGTVQEEACIFKVPNVTLRDVTERPETVECGSNLLSGANTENIMACVNFALYRSPDWQVPPEYLVPDVSNTVISILLSHFTHLN